MSLKAEAKIEAAAHEAWQRLSSAAPADLKAEAFEDCFKTAFAAGVSWTCDALGRPLVVLVASRKDGGA